MGFMSITGLFRDILYGLADHLSNVITWAVLNDSPTARIR